MSASVVWFEVMGNNGKELRSFYGDLFGWKFKLSDKMDYGLVEANEKGIPGGVGTSPASGWTTFYVEVSDIDACIEHSRSLGGQVLMPKTPLPDSSSEIAVVADPEGNPVGLVRMAA